MSSDAKTKAQANLPESGLEATVAPDPGAPISGVDETVAALDAKALVSGVDETVPAPDPRAPVSGADETVLADSGAPTRPGHLNAGKTGEVQKRASEAVSNVPGAEREDLPELVTVTRQHYTEGAEFARGGMGRIVAARDRRLGRAVALKELLVARPDLRLRFEREARITGRLQHPSIVPIYEHGQWPSGEPFYAMKHIEGRPLWDLIAEADTATERLSLLPKVTAVAEAMAYAHSKGVIHRDLKPQNVLVGAYGETVVIDWGLAKELDGDADSELEEAVNAEAGEGDSGLTMAGAVMGTPAYMPPEQARGEAVDERADVYALGAILYNCLSGLPPYRGETSDMVITALLSGPPRALRQVQPELPPDLSSIVDKAMAVEPGERYPSAEELAEDLRRYEMGQLVGAHHYGGADLVRRWVKKNRVVVSLSALFLVVLAVFGIWSVGRIVSERNRATAERGRAVKASEHARRKEAAARKSEAEATTRLAQFYVDEGRRELLAGHPRRALAYLGEARRLGHRSLALRILLARVARLARPLLAVIATHRTPVEAVAFGPRGGGLTTAGQDGTLKRWSVPGGKLRSRCTLPGYPIAFSHDASRLIIGQREFGDLAVVDAKTCKRLCVLRGLAAPGAMKISLSADSRRVAAADAQGTVAVWDVATCRTLHSWPGPKPSSVPNPKPAPPKVTPTVPTVAQPVSARFFARSLSPDGRRLALVTPAGAAELWDVDSGTRLATTAAGHTKPVVAVAMSPDSRLLAIGSLDQTAGIWDTASGKLLHRLGGHRQALTTLAFSPDGKRLVTASLDNTARLWEVGTGRLVASLRGHSNAVKRVAFSPRGGRLLTWGDDRSLRLWDAETGAYFATFKGHHDHVTTAVFDPAGTRVVSAGHDQRALLWKATLEVIRHPVAGNARHVALSPDGARLLLADVGGRLWMGSSAPGAPLSPLGTAGKRVLALALDARGRRALVSRLDGVTLWDMVAQKPLRKLVGHRERVVALAFGPRGRQVATASWDETARLWDVATGKVSHVLAGHYGEVISVSFSADNRLLATTSSDGIVRVWDRRSGNLMAAAGVSGSKLVAARFSADGRRLVSVSDDLRIVTWRSRDGAMLASVDAKSAPFSRAHIAAQGRVILTSSWKSARLWDAETGKLLERFDGGRGAISADARRVVTLDPSTGRPTVRVVPQEPLSAAQLRQLSSRSPWRLRQRRLVRRPVTSTWSREPALPASPPGAALLDDPAMGVRIRHLQRWGVQLGPEHYLLERRFGKHVRAMVQVSMGHTPDAKNKSAFVSHIMKKELKLKFSVTRRWTRFAGRAALRLRGPQLTGQAAVQWIILPRGKHPVVLQLTIDGANWGEGAARQLLAELGAALTISPPWRDTAANRKKGFPFAGDLGRVRLPAGWKLKKYGPGATVEFTAPGGGETMVRVLGPDGAVWCDQGNRFPESKKTSLSGRPALRYECPTDEKEQVFYTVRVGRSLLYVALTDGKTKGLSGPVTKFPSLLKLRAKRRR